jgi:membrane-associated phospholipid phosphatase
MRLSVENNYKNLRLQVYIAPAILLLIIASILYHNNAINPKSYIEFQKKWFYDLNAFLSQLPNIQYNLTQIGDATICLSLLTVLFLKYPKFWEALISASIFSAIFSKILKEFFSVPRPASALNTDSFVIIGKMLPGSTSSLPSGHSITILTVFTVLMFAFMPKNIVKRTMWFAAFLITGIAFAMSRVAIGAHFPIDVLVGCIVGYMSGISGIFFVTKYNFLSWIGLKKYYPIFIVLFLIATIFIVYKINLENLFIYYITLVAILYSLTTICISYVKK